MTRRDTILRLAAERCNPTEIAEYVEMHRNSVRAALRRAAPMPRPRQAPRRQPRPSRADADLNWLVATVRA